MTTAKNSTRSKSTNAGNFANDRDKAIRAGKKGGKASAQARASSTQKSM